MGQASRPDPLVGGLTLGEAERIASADRFSTEPTAPGGHPIDP